MTDQLSRFHRDERGAGLVAVLILGLVMTGLVTTTLVTATAGMHRTRDEQDWLAAMDAAQSGVDDYLYRLNQDTNYWSVPDPTNLAFTQWVPVPGVPSGSFFRYEADISQITTSNMIDLTAHGSAYGEVRTIEVGLRKTGFLDYIYFTEYETTDPASYDVDDILDDFGIGPEPPDDYDTWVEFAQVECSHHRYEVWLHPSDGSERTGRHDDCKDIYWRGGSSGQDVVDGPFHTNDTVAVSGNPRWTAEATTSLPESFTDRWYDRSPTSAPEFDAYPDDNPRFHKRIEMPPSNNAIRAQADYAIGADGCLYTGPTRIEFIGDQVEITSPFTHTTGSGCVTDGTMPIRPNMVIYVQDVPTEGDNSEDSGCSENPLRYDAPDPDHRLFVEDDVLAAFGGYPCRAGDAFVNGDVDGKVTVAAARNVTIVDDITLAGGTVVGSDDVIGLVANNYVEIYHPLDYSLDNLSRANGYNGLPSGEWETVTVEAAMLSTSHSFRVQLHRFGDPLGDLNVTGVIAQLYRGPVGTFNSSGDTTTGYRKNYVYDDRLRYLSPPHYLDPIDAGWGRTTYAELSPAHPPAP